MGMNATTIHLSGVPNDIIDYFFRSSLRFSHEKTIKYNMLIKRESL
jgi:hypothetical protein